MLTAVQEVYAGAQEAGARIAGISEVEVTDALAGDKDNPTKIGDRVKVTVRVAEGGRLLPRRGDAKPTDPPAVSLLIIESSPQVMLDSNGDPQTVFVTHARLVDVATQRVVDTGRSGPTSEETAQAQDGRPYHEYMNDPGYVDTSISSEAQTREDSVKQAMGRIDLGNAGSSGKGRKKVIAAGAAATVVALGIAGIALSGPGDAPAEKESTTAQIDAEPSEPAPSPEPTEAATTDVTTQIGLAPGNDLRINGTFEPGRCGGSPFQSRLVMSDNGDHIGMEQIHPGGARQESSGYALSDGETIVLFDHGDNYDEMYILQAGNKSGTLVGVNFYGDEGILPTAQDIPRLEDILAENGFARDVIDGGPPRNQFLEMPVFPGPASDLCDLELTFRY